MEMDDQLGQWLADQVPLEVLSAPLSDESAGKVVERLKQEAERLWSSTPNRSLELADRIIAIGRARGDVRQTALGLMSRGDYLKLVGDMTEAWHSFEQAGDMYLLANDEVGWARTRIGRLYLGPKLDCVPTTLVDAEQARAIFIRHDEQDRIVRLDLQTALVYNYLGEQHRALELMTRALTLAETLGEVGKQHIGPLYTNMGLAYYALGDFHRALEYYERARELMAARNETLKVAIVEADIAEIAQAQGHYRRALKLLHSVMEHTADESPFETTMTRQHIVECYLSLNRYVEARDLVQQVIQDCRTFNASYELAQNLLHLATAEAALANFIAAQEALAEAESIFTSLGAKSWVAMVQLWRGRIALKRADVQSAYQDAVAAGTSFQADGQQVRDAEATLLQGQALFALSEYDAAAHAGHKALRIAQHFNVPSLRYAAHLLLGQIAEARHTNVRAIRYYKAAAATIERVQRGLTITLRPGFLEDKGEAMRALIALHLRSGEIGSALETLERAKSQVWLSYLINREHLRWARDESHSRALIEELDRLRDEHQWFFRLAHNPPTDSGGSIAVQSEQALSEVAVRERRMRAITDQLYLHTSSQWDNQAAIFSLEEIQQGLEEGTQLVEYYGDGDQWWAFVFDRHTVRVHRLPLTGGDLSQIMRLTRNNFLSALELGPHTPNARALTQQAQKMLGRLYDMLIEPLGFEENDPQKLIIVPYGALHALPFQLLYSKSTYLIERREVFTLPAAGLVIRKGPKRTPGALVLAHSSDGRLVHVHREAEFVHETFGGELFMDETVTRSVLQRMPTQILHIAAHGEHRLDQPDLSYLQFEDCQLYTDDVLQQDLSYELVTLSACETGQANVAANEELIGLGRGFLYAGAGALILSLWAVADDSTTELMKRMYDALSQGKSKAASLRNAQTSILAGNRHLHPAYWGAFQLIGDDSPLSNSELNRLL